MQCCKPEDDQQTLRIKTEAQLKVIEGIQKRRGDELNQLQKRYEEEMCKPHIQYEEEQNRLRTRYEEELNVLRYPLSEDRRRLNAMQPVATLLPEILVHIFDLCLPNPPIHSRYSELRHASHSERCLQFLKILRICSHWRAVALGAASLWYYVDMTLPAIALHTLTWSKNCPLVVIEEDSLAISGIRSVELRRRLIIELFERHSHRIQRLHAMKLPPEATITHPSQLIALHYVRLHNRHPRTNRVPEGRKPWYMWLMRLPCLKRLDLEGKWQFPDSMPVDFHFPGTLEFLKLSFQSGSHTLSANVLISSLLNGSGVNSRLTELVLENICDAVLPSQGPYPILDFPNLENLTIKDNGPVCTFILRHMTTPPGILLQVEADFSSTGTADLPIRGLFRTLLDKQATASGDRPISRLQVKSSHYLCNNITKDRFWVAVSGHSSSDDINAENQLFTIAFAVRYSDSLGDLIRLVENYCINLPISEVQTLSSGLSLPPEAASSLDLPNLLSATPVISMLEVRSWETLCRLPFMLRPCVQARNGCETEILPLPKLTRVLIQDAFNPLMRNQTRPVFLETFRGLEDAFRARSQISFRPLSVKVSQITQLGPQLLTALVKAFTMGNGILQGLPWVETEQDGLPKQYPYNTRWIAMIGHRRNGVGAEDLCLWYRFFIAYKPTIPPCLDEERPM
ncbi:hypothetical protein QCA50_005974 [Cerrena zonata]|uniref:F-box domain-containing protein n=1 Tax=Cerrena zonata TaxID=2478898 RepID=A0AAW0GGM9_9APHY